MNLTSLRSDDDASDWIDVMGPKMKPLTKWNEDYKDYMMFLCILPPGVAVPMHKHEDRETFYVLEGEAQGWVDGAWNALSAGEILDIHENEPHAWRNVSNQEVKLILVTTAKMGAFFELIGRPLSAGAMPPTPEALAHLFETADRFGYWLAPPEENARIGLAMPPIGQSEEFDNVSLS
ncbi:cupin domain-containing protein [Oryzifoliimicrobium ureilyticus]|uniref:cupin domain-containing protein n=1 Tax=Oryzifoliimicrobium ureilyticus TaxID=3113724 RepID=UPI00307650A8